MIGASDDQDKRTEHMGALQQDRQLSRQLKYAVPEVYGVRPAVVLRFDSGEHGKYGDINV